MSTFLSPEVQAGLDAARRDARRKASRLNVRAGDRSFRVLRSWHDGFSLDADEAPQLRGLVDLYDGPTHLSRCLIMASGEDGGELEFEYKRITDVSAGQPLDFYRDPDAPAGLLPKA